MHSQFFVQPSETLLDQLTESIEKKPAYQPMLQALKEMQEPVPEAGPVPMFKNDWALVARLALPIDMVARVLEPGFFKDKKVFYRWLQKHPQYCAYDRRSAAARRPFYGFTPEASK